MRADQADQEASKDGVHSNDVGEEGRREHHQQGKGHHRLRRSILDGAVPAQDPQEGGAHQIDQKKGVTHANQKDVEGGEPGAGIHQGNRQGKENPPDDVVGHASRERDGADARPQEFQFRQNTCKHGKRLYELRCVSPGPMVRRWEGKVQ